MRAFLDWLGSAERVLLSGHQRADGDCLGSIALLHHALTAAGKRVEVVLPDPPDPRFAVLAEHTPFAVFDPAAGLPRHDALVVCDCSHLGRLGSMEAAVRASGIPRGCVDHHPMAEVDRADWQAILHDAAGPATGLLAWRLVEALGVDPGESGREGAFLALASDTGWFRHANTSAEVWQLAAELVGAGLDTDRLHRAVFHRNAPSHPRGIAAALATTEYHCGGRLVLAWADPAELDRVAGRLEDSDEVLDLLRAVEGVEVVGFVHRRDGRYRASLRSRGRVDVNSVARGLGGGGHTVAAGLSFDAGVRLDEAVGALRDALVEAAAAAGLDPA